MKPLTRMIGTLLTLLVVACGHPEKTRITSFNGTVEDYKLGVAYKVATNWAFAFDKNSAIPKDEARILITIDKHGHVKDIVFVKEASDKMINRSILDAIRKSEPFPAFPKIISEDQIEVGIRATPKGFD